MSLVHRISMHVMHSNDQAIASRREELLQWYNYGLCLSAHRVRIFVNFVNKLIEITILWQRSN